MIQAAVFSKIAANFGLVVGRSKWKSQQGMKSRDTIS